jgi:rod shape-determining protein MreC
VIRLSPARRAAIKRITLPLLIALSATMIVVGKADQVVFESARTSVTDAIAPMLDIFARPMVALDTAIDRAQSILAVYRANAQLSDENERLLGWRQAALRLAAENTELRELLKLAPEPPISYLTARTIAESGGAYAKNVIVDAGRENGIVRGEAAVTGEGLAGRVSEVGARTARILLITDLNSRVPVLIEGSRQRAILVGDNSQYPELRYLDSGSAVSVGDRIVTSGQGGVFPPGLPVGVVAGLDGELPRVEPYADLSRVDYLRLLNYGLADGLPNPLSLAPRGGKRAESLGSGQPLRY